MNLLTNAREAMPEGGQIRIETTRPPSGRLIRLVVTDTGTRHPGRGDLERSLDPFFTTTKRTSDRSRPRCTYGIIQEHGGTVDVQSRPGDGTTFILSFPTPLRRPRRKDELGSWL